MKTYLKSEKIVDVVRSRKNNQLKQNLDTLNLQYYTSRPIDEVECKRLGIPICGKEPQELDLTNTKYIVLGSYRSYRYMGNIVKKPFISNTFDLYILYDLNKKSENLFDNLEFVNATNYDFKNGTNPYKVLQEKGLDGVGQIYGCNNDLLERANNIKKVLSEHKEEIFLQQRNKVLTSVMVDSAKIVANFQVANDIKRIYASKSVVKTCFGSVEFTREGYNEFSYPVKNKVETKTQICRDGQLVSDLYSTTQILLGKQASLERHIAICQKLHNYYNKPLKTPQPTK